MRVAISSEHGGRIVLDGHIQVGLRFDFVLRNMTGVEPIDIARLQAQLHRLGNELANEMERRIEAEAERGNEHTGLGHYSFPITPYQTMGEVATQVAEAQSEILEEPPYQYIGLAETLVESSP